MNTNKSFFKPSRKVLAMFSLLTVILAIELAISPVWARVVADIPAPQGFERTQTAADSFASFSRAIPLKPENRIKLWNGRFLPDDTYHSTAVLGLPLLFDQDLEQCADFAMRLWAEYLKSTDRLSKLSLYDFNGRKRPFDDSGKSFKKYLHWHMSYSNSYSIKLGANKVRSPQEVRAGDMYVQNNSDGGIGHVSMIVDEAINAMGLKVYLVGYSFMPAQEFHIEEASSEHGIEGWFTVDGYRRYAETVFGAFGSPIIMRF